MRFAVQSGLIDYNPSSGLSSEGTDRAQILRDIFFCLVTEEQKIGLLRLNIAEKKHGRE
ncbi:hypothetical protein O5849_18030 [Escherichia coli]|nr:hypothetical protein [Escherichia coli]